MLDGLDLFVVELRTEMVCSAPLFQAELFLLCFHIDHFILFPRRPLVSVGRACFVQNSRTLSLHLQYTNNETPKSKPVHTCHPFASIYLWVEDLYSLQKTTVLLYWVHYLKPLLRARYNCRGKI